MPFIASPNTFKNDSAKLNRKWGTITKRSDNHGGLSGNEAHWNTTTPAVILVLFDSGFVNKRESANDNMISEICLQKLSEKMLAEGLLLSVSSLISEQKSSPARPGNGKTKPDVKGKKKTLQNPQRENFICFALKVLRTKKSQMYIVKLPVWKCLLPLVQNGPS